FDVFLASLPELVAAVGDLVQRAHLLLSDPNLEAVTATLGNLAASTGRLPQLTHELSALGTELRGASADLAATMKGTRELIDAAGPDVAGAAGRLRSISEHLASATQRLDRVIAGRSAGRPEQVYYPRAPSTDSAQPSVSAPGDGSPRPPGASLRVAHPLTGPGLDASHIMLIQADHRMNFFAGSRWPAPVADVIEALAVETLRGSGDWSSVEDSTSPFPSDYLLQVAVRRFEADYTTRGGAPEVHVMLDC